MVKLAPKIDQRTAQDIVNQVQELLVQYTGETSTLQGTSKALVEIFARFTEIIIQRLNQVPDKNFLAFLDLLGASRLPPQSARVPLTFFLAAGSTVDGVVPLGTQVAAPPAEGEQDPVIFETERELVVSAAELDAIFIRDPQQDLYRESSSILTNSTSVGVPIFRGNQSIEHIFYIGHNEFLGFSEIATFTLKINLSKALGASGEVQWQIATEIDNGIDWQDITPSDDQTQGLTQTGENQEIEFSNIKDVPLSTVNSVTNRWLRCLLLTPISIVEETLTGVVSANQLPEITDIKVKTTINVSNLLVDTAFTNQLPIDITKDFFPFGEKPKFGDILYLANSEAFSQKNAQITLDIILTNPATGGEEPPIPRTRTEGNPELNWEFWDGQEWQEIVAISQGEEQPFTDTTDALTISNAVTFTFPKPPVQTSINGIESFWIRVRITSGNYGTEARYERIEPTPDPPASEYRFVEATFAAPSIKSIKVEYQLTTSEETPEALFTYNDAVYSSNLIQTLDDLSQVISEPFKPFQQTEATKPTLYLGFSLPPDREQFPNRTISIFNSIANLKYGEKLIPVSPNNSRRLGEVGTTVFHKFYLTNNSSESVEFKLTVLGTNWETNLPESLVVPANDFREVEVRVEIPTPAPVESRDRGWLQLSPTHNPSLIETATFETFVGTELPLQEQLQLSWQYWNGQEWSKLTVRDDTDNFTRPGLIEFIPPGDFSSRADFNLAPRYWLRVQWLKGDYEVEPRLEQILLNTTMALQTVTIQNEIIGSSNGNENQEFQTTRQPILIGQQLEIRELEIPSVLERQKIELEEGADAINITEETEEIWVRWHQVKDFYQSTSRDRHYLFDNLTGTITFGDGRSGLIPPLGRGNIRMSRYQTGGGKLGNKPTGSIVQLKTTVPYVDQVINYQAATGGAEEETLESLIERAPREVRHRQRAVTAEDYQDLAKLASPEVIRAKSIPLANLASNPLDMDLNVPGAVSVIIVPRSQEAKPSPSLELIRRVQDYLETYAEPTVEISVIGPLYVRVDIIAEIAVSPLEGSSEVAQTIEQKLANFLHPLTGGFDGTGWDFGRQPYKSDLYRLLERISGVDHVYSLKVNDDFEEPTGAKQTNRFLVYSGNHEISLTFVES